MRESVREVERLLEEELISQNEARWRVKVIFVLLLREGLVTRDEVRAESLEAVTRHGNLVRERVRRENS